LCENVSFSAMAIEILIEIDYLKEYNMISMAVAGGTKPAIFIYFEEKCILKLSENLGKSD
jgi:hypothetical protein